VRSLGLMLGLRGCLCSLISCRLEWRVEGN
jgi:hypothetical protein